MRKEKLAPSSYGVFKGADLYSRWNRYVDPTLLPVIETSEINDYREALRNLQKPLSTIERKIIGAHINGNTSAINNYLQQAKMKTRYFFSASRAWAHEYIRNCLLIIAVSDGDVARLKELKCKIGEIRNLDLVAYAGHSKNKPLVLDYFWERVEQKVTEVSEKFAWSAILDRCQYLNELPESELTKTDIKAFFGIPAIDLAGHYGNFDYVAALNKRGIKAEDTTFDPNLEIQYAIPTEWLSAPALIMAIEGDCLDCTRLLLARGASPVVPDCSGVLPLHHAAKNTPVAYLNLLLQHGATLKSEGTTALHYASRYGRSDCTRFLLSQISVNDHDSYLNRINKKGETALHFAARRNSSNCVAELLEHGANPNLLSSRGQTAIDEATEGTASLALLLLVKHLQNVEKGVTLTNSLEDAYEAHPEAFKLFVKAMFRKNSTWYLETKEMRVYLLENSTVQSLFSETELSQLREVNDIPADVSMSALVQSTL